jgi:hypothetical protein
MESQPGNRQAPPTEDADWISHGGKREEGQDEQGQVLQHPTSRGTEATTHEALRTALTELEEAAKEEARATETRWVWHGKCKAAGWPRRDTHDAGEKAINVGFSRANDRFYEAIEARKAKEEEVSKLQGAMAHTPGAQETDKSEAGNHPAEEAERHAKSGAERMEEGPGEPKKRRSRKTMVHSHERDARKEEWMEAVKKESAARYNAEERYAAWAKGFKSSIWAQDPIEACAEKEEEFRQLSAAITEAKALKQAVDSAEERHNLQEAAEEVADSASQGSYSSGELVIHGSREEAEREALAGYAPPDPPESPQEEKDQ